MPTHYCTMDVLSLLPPVDSTLDYYSLLHYGCAIAAAPRRLHPRRPQPRFQTLDPRPQTLDLKP
eukprot:731477-Rhodomonas_salina.1